MPSTKEQIQKAALTAFQREEVSIGEAKAVLCELSQAKRRQLNARLYITAPDSDEPLTFNAEGKEDPKGEQWHFRDGIKYLEEWICATIEPAFTVDEITDWPDSLKRSLFEQSRRINGIPSVETVAKNS